MVWLFGRFTPEEGNHTPGQKTYKDLSEEENDLKTQAVWQMSDLKMFIRKFKNICL